METRIGNVAAAVARLRQAVAAALAGGPDPCEISDICNDIDTLSNDCSVGDPGRIAAFTDALKDPGSVPGVSRQVVLARGQRLLLSLSMALDDASDEEAPRDDRSRSRSRAKRSSEPSTPFDPTLLDLDGVGPKTASRLASRGLISPVDVLFWLPRRYDDRRRVTPISELSAGQRVVTRGEVRRVRVYGRPWRRMMDLEVADGDASVHGVWFTNRRPRPESFAEGEEVVLAGLVSDYRGRLQIAHPVVARGGEGGDRFGRVVPVYAEVPGVAGRVVEKAVRSAAIRSESYVRDAVPREILTRRGLLPLGEALSLAHLPPDDVSPGELDAWIDGSSPAHRRLAYDEFFYIQLALALRRRRTAESTAPRIEAGEGAAAEAGEALGVVPTRAQHRVSAEIAADIGRGSPMRRLLQGDVGSGKTLVALASVLAVAGSGLQAAIMAPTEILAEQHMRTLQPALRARRLGAVLHIGAARSSTRKRTVAAIESGRADVVIGTHALIQEPVRFARLGLAIVDEQHRFGVAQRLGLVGKGPDGRSPHLLVMTATPIPRTLALTVHGDLDVSVLDELPPGRTPVTTRVWDRGERERAFEAVEAALGRGEQAYVVCPIIEESEKVDVRAAEEVHEEARARFGEDRVGLLHGRLPPERRDEVMGAFAEGSLGVLVTTTVVEVGVDVPGATVMVVEGAERFGLAQLHQLRGRVGRSDRPSECHLVADPTSGDAAERLAVLARTSDGFEIAEADLAIRGPGELYGRRQAGLPGFRFGHLVRDADLLIDARRDVSEILDRGGDNLDPLREELARRIMAGDGPVGEESG